MLASLFGHGQVSSRFRSGWMVFSNTESSEPASGVAQDVLDAGRCELGYPADREYNNENGTIACHILPVVLSAGRWRPTYRC